MPTARVLQALAAAVVLAILALSGSGIAQQMPTLAGQNPSQNQDQPQDQSLETFKVNVDVVQLFFNVKDKKGALLPNLTKNDFDILEDGKPQTIKYFAAESNLPLTLGILIDSSPSQTRVLGMEKEVGGSFVNEIIREKDLAFVMSFDAQTDLLQDFTNSTRLLREAMNSARIGVGSANAAIPQLGGGPVPTLSHGCCTMLYDAVYLASHEELAQQVGRKAMILLTDGEDEGSKLKIQDAIEAAQKSDAICYVLLVADRGGTWQGFGGGEMKKLTQETGGRVIEVGNNFEKLKDAFNQIAHELRSQYNIGYTPTNSARDGTFRKVEVRSKGGYKVQARTGYYAMARKD
jgi:VWFA-related protein